jgi:hypothetical protein
MKAALFSVGTDEQPLATSRTIGDCLHWKKWNKGSIDFRAQRVMLWPRFRELLLSFD